ncbi:MAG: peptide-methionine (S)-S-oxide reductase MsrA, partial [Verrucomicrobiae bacterium]|nr:peptide-methionine (S)-S-oxide reductase MsrA [Verrucomicrobiae bacterium]
MNWRGVILMMAMACKVSGALPAPERGLSETDTVARAVFAGGCFWCVEAAFEQVPGVMDVVSGYAGGEAATANYEQVCRGTTGHAEAVEVTYDPRKVSYGALLRVFFTAHDPTTKNRQGPDV